MDKKEIGAAIERLRDVDARGAWQIAGVFLGTDKDSVDVVEFHDRLLELLHIASTALDVQDVIDDEYIRLPVDADGVPIRVGDVLEANRGTVTCIRDAGHGWEIVTDHAYSYNPADLRHYHAPTIEDVMVEFATYWESAMDGEDKTAILKEYATKLKLAD